MPEPLKNMYNDAFFGRLTGAMQEIDGGFDAKSFITRIHEDDWKHMELKERMRHISITLHDHLPGSYEDKVHVLLDLVSYITGSSDYELGFEYMFLPDFVEVYGIDEYETSIPAMERITQFSSCEFAVRPFIIRYYDKMIAQMMKWSNHEHHMVRRLASEGCRPRLPWAMALPSLKKDPSDILPILENLKDDEYEIVRRSVANNLNDISKDNPDTVISLVKKWKGKTPETDWVVKHASRTLLKQGHPEVMSIFGFGDSKKIAVHNFKVLTPNVRIGDYLEFSFDLENTASTSSLIRLEYAVYYVKANGTLSKKVYMISEKEYSGKSITTINRRQSFRIITTRKFHLGEHKVAVIINGAEKDALSFELIE